MNTFENIGICQMTTHPRGVESNSQYEPKPPMCLQGASTASNDQIPET